MPEKDASELPGLVFDIYRIPDMVDGTLRAVTLVAALDGCPLVGVSRQAVNDADNVGMGALVAMVKARPTLTLRDRAVVRHAFLTNKWPDPFRYSMPLEAAWEGGKFSVNPTHRVTIRRGILPEYIWFNGRYQVALALQMAGRISREKLHDLTMEYAVELRTVLRYGEAIQTIVDTMRNVGLSLASSLDGSIRFAVPASKPPTAEPSWATGHPGTGGVAPAAPPEQAESRPASESEPAHETGDHAKSENLVGEEREPRLTSTG